MYSFLYPMANKLIDIFCGSYVQVHGHDVWLVNGDN